MKELLVYINKGSTLPAWDCRVEIRTSDEDPWKQAIEDGYVGVYRRAAKVDDRDHSSVQVRIRAEGDETVLIFPYYSQTCAAGNGRVSIVSDTLTKYARNPDAIAVPGGRHQPSVPVMQGMKCRGIVEHQVTLPDAEHHLAA